MLHTKSRGSRSTGSREEDFEGFSCRRGCHVTLVMWPRYHDKLLFPLLMKASHKVWLQVDWQSGFGGEDV